MSQETVCPVCQVTDELMTQQPVSRMVMETLTVSIYVEAVVRQISNKKLCSNHGGFVNMLLGMSGIAPISEDRSGTIG